ncbi:MAG: hypothetical protein JO212_18030, partial [Acetobacteraceae bacterium]|nr:hypothetical protein [Acetobacteraceae bacterium]
MLNRSYRRRARQKLDLDGFSRKDDGMSSPGDRFDAPHLAKSAANYTALTPLGFLPRAAAIYPEKLAVIHGGVRFTYRQLYQRCRRLADALRRRGIGR